MYVHYIDAKAENHFAVNKMYQFTILKYTQKDWLEYLSDVGTDLTNYYFCNINFL